MISVVEAKSIIKNQITSLGSINLNLDDAVGYAVEEDILSPMNVPSFVQSSMDGYAFSFNDLKNNPPLKIAQTIQAGDTNLIELQPLEAVRIFTGAPLPIGADTVLMQEKAKVDADQLYVLDEHIQKGINARVIGADIQKGAVAIKKGTLLTPGAIGFLASLGLTHVAVTRKPSVHIILTGNELQEIGNELTRGQIYESNSHTLLAGLHQFGINDISIEKVTDNLEMVSKAIELSLSQFDLTIITGGISVGDYDYVLEACNQNKVTQLFHKVKQKPGKPLYIGKKEDKVICALPGNPASVLSCFYNYVSLVLDQLSNTQLAMKMIHGKLINDYKKPAGLTHFLKAYYDYAKNEVQILEGQESFKMSAFVTANCFVELSEELIESHAGQMVIVHLFKL